MDIVSNFPQNLYLSDLLRDISSCGGQWFA